jgi:uncharacterized protein with HEPN domain
MLTLALIKAIEIIGEAASKISQESRETQPDIQWNKLVGMRNRLIHAYSDVNLDILWQTVTTALPPLVHALEEMIESE